MLALFNVEFMLRVLEKTFLWKEYQYDCVGVRFQ
jgi:hypothetical protein